MTTQTRIIKTAFMRKAILAVTAAALIAGLASCNKDNGERLPQIITLKDTSFHNYILANYDINGDNVINLSEVQAITELDLRGNLVPGETDRYTGYGIKSLEGIEYFSNLTKLDCSFNGLSSLELSKNKLLKELYCRDNSLARLDISGCVMLRKLDCRYNSIQSLNLAKCTELTHIDCKSNPLKSLDVSANRALESLNCHNTQLTSLNVSGNNKLETLECSSNSLTSLDLQDNTSLKELSCQGNALASLVLTGNLKIKHVDCSDNSIVSSMDIYDNLALEYFKCTGNENDIFLYIKDGQQQSITELLVDGKVTIRELK